ncbi:hypothetical protein KUCAC02_033520, partial [Chaenocephalus aceratus]
EGLPQIHRFLRGRNHRPKDWSRSKVSTFIRLCRRRFLFTQTSEWLPGPDVSARHGRGSAARGQEHQPGVQQPVQLHEDGGAEQVPRHSEESRPAAEPPRSSQLHPAGRSPRRVVY